MWCFPTILLLLWASDGASAQPDPLVALRGTPAIVEFPTLEDLEVPLPGLPKAWGYLQVDAENFAELKRRFDLRADFALLYLDRFGNALYRDESSSRRSRVGTGLREFERRRSDLERRLETRWEAARRARERGKPAAELKHIASVLELDVAGYPEIASARERLTAIEKARWDDLIRILAKEGLISRKELLAALRQLESRSLGLAVEKRIRRERQRVDRGITVRRGA